jgi:hypothetical protein
MQMGKDTHDTAAASPLLRDTQNVIAALPRDDAVAAARHIAEALAAISGNTAPSPKERYDAVCALDEAAVPHTDALRQEYLNTTRHTRQRESELWQGAYRCWCELAAAYALCAQGSTASAAPGNAQPYARVAAARAIRALRRQLQWLRIRYAPPPPQLWESLAALLVWSEAAGLTGEFLLYPGINTTLQHQVLKTLALAVLTGDNLMPPEQELANRIVNHFANTFTLSRLPGAGCTHSFDVKQAQAPALLGDAVPPGAELRYFGADAAVAALSAALHALEQGLGVPPALGFANVIEPALLTPVLRQICLDWAGKPSERRQQREKTNARVSVLPGFGEIASEIDRSMADPFDFTAKATGESWIASDISPDGFGVVMPAVSGDWVSVGSVLGIEGEAAGAWSVGIVRRVRRLDGGRLHIGVQVLCRHAQAVRVMREAPSAAAGVTQRMPVDRGILLTADAMHQPQIELLVSDASLYDASTLHVVTGDGALLVKLDALLEVTADCARVRLTVQGIEK